MLLESCQCERTLNEGAREFEVLFDHSVSSMIL